MKYILNNASLLLIGLLPLLNVATAQTAKPNIVHILTDDLGWQDVAVYYRAVHGKESIYETPHMDRLAKNGMRFMQAYSPSATCAPSRAAYMAGQYTPHTGVLHVNGSKPPTPFQSQFQYIDGYYPMRLALDTPTVAGELKKGGLPDRAYQEVAHWRPQQRLSRSDRIWL